MFAKTANSGKSTLEVEAGHRLDLWIRKRQRYAKYGVIYYMALAYYHVTAWPQQVMTKTQSIELSE